MLSRASNVEDRTGVLGAPGRFPLALVSALLIFSTDDDDHYMFVSVVLLGETMARGGHASVFCSAVAQPPPLVHVFSTVESGCYQHQFPCLFMLQFSLNIIASPKFSSTSIVTSFRYNILFFSSYKKLFKF